MEKITQNNAARVKEVDSGVKNKFSFKWLESVVELEIDGKKFNYKVDSDIVKIITPGSALCELCNKLINYSNRGFVAISDHIKCKRHGDLVKERLQTPVIKGFFSQTPTTTPRNDLNNNCIVKAQPENPFMAVPMCDRVSNSEAMLLGFLAENSLPFTMAPKLVDLAKNLGKDQKALNHFTMDRTTASYKMKYGMSETLRNRTIENLKVNKFSLNMDESTSTNLHRVLTILVSYYDPQRSSVVVEHLSSLDVIKVNAESITNHIVHVFEELGIPWSNLVSVLMDSCNVMRGSKSGVEVRLKQYAPHLVDIDGDTCHHIHNAAKKFCEPFNWWVERLFTDLANDVKWSVDIRDAMKEIAMLLNVKFTMPEQYISHRWLSCYDVAVNTKRLYDVFRIFYYSFLDKEDKAVYKEVVGEVYDRQKVGKKTLNKIRDIQTILEKKKLTSDGKNRKMRIIERIFQRQSKTELILNFYIAVLPMLKGYVVLFESKTPLIHKLMEKQEDLMAKFLACIVQPESVLNKSGRLLMKVDLSENSKVFLKEKDMFIGAANRKIVKSLSSKDVNVIEFRRNAATAYITCARHLQKKLPLDNKVLYAAAAIDPIIRSDVSTASLLNRLPEIVENVLVSNEEEEEYCTEVKDYQVDRSLPAYEEVPIDKWWDAVNKSGKYPTLCKMVFTLLSCFHGPQVESSFSVMGDVINSRTGRMKIDTYSAIQTVRYSLASEGTCAVKKYARFNPVKDPVDKPLCRNLRGAAAKYGRIKKDAKSATNVDMNKLESKTDNKKKQAALAEQELVNHELRMVNKRRKLALEKLANRH